MATGGKRRGRGEGSIEVLPSGLFRAVLSARKRTDGTRDRRTATFPTKRAALAQLRRWQHQHADGTLPADAKMLLSAWLDQWLLIRKPNVEARTFTGYESRVKLHLTPRIGSVPLAQLRPLHVERLLADMAADGYSASERQKVGGVLRTALRYAVKVNLIARSPMADIKLPKVTRPEKTALDADQAARLLAAAHRQGHRLAAVFDFWIDTGARPGEVYALHWPDVDLDAGTVYIHLTVEDVKGKLRLKEPKTDRSRRRLRLAARTLAALRVHRDRMAAEGRDVERGLVFPAPGGSFLRQGYFASKVLRPVLRAAGLPTIRPYDLRHTSATLLLSRDVNLRVVSERLGHESIEITLKHYAHCLPGMQQRAAAAIDGLFGAIVPQMSHRGGEI